MNDYIMNTYSRFPLTLVKGSGMYVFDDDGNKYLDFVAGIAVNSLGHAHPRLVEAISRQAGELIHVSNLYYTSPQLAAAQKLAENSCFDKVFFCNSGAEAVEAALKLARKYGKKTAPDKTEIITMQNSFHGRTYGAVSATGQEKYQKGLDPLLPGIRHVPFNDKEALEQTASAEKTCAVLLEPIQGEGGIIPAQKEYLDFVRKFCNEKDIVLIYDEIQCGIGRTGRLFAYENYGAEPDVAVIAKGIAGGVPMGAMLAKEKFAESFKPGDHASTFGGNPLAAAAANVVLDELLDRGLLEQAKESGAYLKESLLKLQERFPCIVDVRGVGLMMGIELDKPAAEIVRGCIQKGLLLVGSGEKVIRFVPPLIVTKGHIDEMMGILGKVLEG